MKHIDNVDIKQRVREQVKSTIKRYNMINAGDSVVVGLSGGPDSVCLIHSLATLSDDLGIKQITAVHINHGLRGEDSDGDEDYAKQLASEIGAEFRSYRVDVNSYAKDTGLGTELAGRRLRYGIFEAVSRDVGAAAVAVAHNSDDQAETVLMRIMRGTGLNGLSGIVYVRNLEKAGIDVKQVLHKIESCEDKNSKPNESNVKSKPVRIIRPVLNISRTDIEAYCDAYDLKPHIDHTNLLPIYTRNKIRLNLLPIIEKDFNPEVKKALVRLANQAAEDESCLHEVAFEKYKKRWNDKEKSLNLKNFKKLHKATASRLLRICAASVGLERDIEAHHIDRIIELIYAGEESKEADISKKYFVRYSYGKLWFSKRYEEKGIVKKSIKFPFEALESEGKTEIDTEHIKIKIKLRDKEKSGKREADKLHLDYDLLKNYTSVIIRTRMPGDRIRVRGLNGSKKVQDFMTDRKIPKHKRDELPLIAADGNIISAGKEAAEDCAVTESTKRVSVISFEEKDSQN